MNDTPAAVEKKFRDMLMSRSGEQRLMMGCAMFDSAKSIAQASLSAYSGYRQKVLLFERLYGQDFDAATRARIVAAIKERCER